MHLLSVSRLSRSTRWVVAVAAVVLAVGGTLLGSLASASAGPPPPDDVDFSRLNARSPVAGHRFEGLAIINRTGLNGSPRRFSSVRCDAEIGGKRLRARHLVYGEPRNGDLQVIVCGWFIPADTAGKTLRFWQNAAGAGGRCAVVRLRPDGNASYSKTFTWRVTNP